MSEENENEYKKIKAEYGVESSSEETSEEFDGESGDSSYILVSEDELYTEESDSDVQEQDYFDSESEEEESEKSEVAWEDSDDNLVAGTDLREELDEDAAWLTTEGVQKKIKIEPKKISFKIKRNVFTANCRIKLLKVFPECKVLVDSFNLIYIIKSFEEFKTYKIDFFKITDFCMFNGKIIFSSNNSAYMKQMTLDGKVTDVKKQTGNIKKMIAKEYLYILGDKLFAFNQNMSLSGEFNASFIDFCVGENSIVCLREDGDLYQFDLNLNFKTKVSFSFKFQFKSIYFAAGMFLVGTTTGILAINSELKQIKSFSNMSDEITSLENNKNFIVHGSANENSLRILKVNGLNYFDKFPFSKIRINPITTIAVEDDTFYFSDSKFVTSLKLTYI